MRTAIVKQVLDVFGPWRSLRWTDTNPRRIFDFWPSKAFMWEMTCLLEADWYIVPQVLDYGYTRQAVLNHPGRKEAILRHAQGIVSPDQIPFSEYDLVISIDPILPVPTNSTTLFAYYMQEHWDALYTESRKRPLAGYDLFLDHLLEAPAKLSTLPQPVAFPYMRAPRIARSAFPEEKANASWVDWRLLCTLSLSDDEAAWAAAKKRLEDYLGMPAVCLSNGNQSQFGFTDPPLWGDPARYLQALARCKYYVGMGLIHGAGASLGDAAALGCLCIGDVRKAYHRLICHPDCLCPDLLQLPATVKRLASSPQLQAEALRWQDEKLRQLFLEQPLALLHEAHAMKSARLGLGSSEIASRASREQLQEAGDRRPLLRRAHALFSSLAGQVPRPRGC